MKIKTALRLDRKMKSNAQIIKNGIFNGDYSVGDLNECLRNIKKHKYAIQGAIDGFNNYTPPSRYTRQRNRTMRRKYPYDSWAKRPYEPDTRSGEETYGYKSLDDIGGQLRYISDRYYAQFRLQWMLDLTEIDLKTLPKEDTNE